MATLTTSSMASTLNVPAPDDTMEISSDAGRVDHDIDIDFMGSEHGDENVDWMLQDATSERGYPQAQADEPHNDDLMYDDGEEITYVDEENMEDDVHSYSEAQDGAAGLDIEFDPHPATEETLYDATQDVDLEHEQDYEQPEEETLIDFETFSEHGEEALAEEQAEQAEEATTTFDEVTSNEQLTQLGDLAAPVEAALYDTSTTFDASEVSAMNVQAVVEEDRSTEVQEASNAEQPSAPEVSSQHSSPAQPDLAAVAQASQQEASAELQQEETLIQDTASAPADAPFPEASTKASIHPITIFYALEGFEYSLFPQTQHDDPNTYLLKDTSVASSTLADLFRACRSVLEQQVNDDMELEFYVDSLHLTISEDSVHCRESSLAQIVDVYVDLMHNEGVEAVPALYMELITKERFSTQLTNLFKAASEKKGLYSMKFWEDEQEIPVDAGEQPRVDQDEEQKQNEEQEQEQEREREQEQEQEQEQAPTLQSEQASNAEAEVEAAAPTDEFSYDETAVPVQEFEEDETTQAEESFAAPTETYGDAAEQNSLQPQEGYEESFEEETIAYQEENQEEVQEEGDPSHIEQGQDEEREDFAEDAEQGDGGSSGSSTIQGENQPESTHDLDASFENAEARDGNAEAGEEETAAAIDERQAQFEGFDEQLDTGESYDFNEEHPAETYDESAYATDTFNQEFDDSIDYAVDQDYHEDTQEGFDQLEEQYNWTQGQTHQELEAAHIQNSGTFQVPSSTEDNEDEDEITFNDDEFTFDDAQTQDATVQDPPTDSPLGKRGREDEDDGAIDGSDQESKRLKAS